MLTTYGVARRDAATLASIEWDLVVADEAQHIKNAKSTTARNLRTIPSRGRVALTGTPIENDLTELWAILDWATPGLLGSRTAFRRVWAAPIESGVHPSRARQFADLIEPFVLRRAQVRSRHRARASGQDRDRPSPGPHPRAGGALRSLRPRHDGPHRAGRRASPGADWCWRCSPGSSRSATTPRTSSSSPARSGWAAARRSWTCSRSSSAPSSPRAAQPWCSPSTSPWRG